jgi:hypothetical protein
VIAPLLRLRSTCHVLPLAHATLEEQWDDRIGFQRGGQFIGSIYSLIGLMLQSLLGVLLRVKQLNWGVASRLLAWPVDLSLCPAVSGDHDILLGDQFRTKLTYTPPLLHASIEPGCKKM